MGCSFFNGLNYIHLKKASLLMIKTKYVKKNSKGSKNLKIYIFLQVENPPLTASALWIVPLPLKATCVLLFRSPKYSWQCIGVYYLTPKDYNI